MGKIIKFAHPDLSRQELKAVKKVLDSGWLTTGPHVAAFEQRVAEMSGCKHAVAVDSCTTALEFALRVLGIGPGDEVITTPLTYTATADVIYTVGAKIVFVDTDGESFEMDYDAMEKAITPRTKAIIAVDYGGKICNYERIFEAVNNKKDIFKSSSPLQDVLGRVAVIADAAHSFGAMKGFEPSGSFADITCFSFHVLKCITTGGEGGALVWKNFNDWDEAVGAALKAIRHHCQTGKDPINGWEYDIRGMGFNRPMTDINAAIGLIQLERYPDIYEKRVELTMKYDSMLERSERIHPLITHLGDDYTTSFHLYPVGVKAINGDQEEFRNRVIVRMKDYGIPCNVHYKPLPMMTGYKKLGYTITDYPNAYAQYAQLITLPYHTLLTEKDQERIINTLEQAVKDCD